MNKRYVPVLIGAAILVGVLAFRPWAATDPTSESQERGAPIAKQQPAPPASKNGDKAQPAAPKVTKKKRKIDDAERERYRRAIRDAIAERGAPSKKAPANEDAAPPAREDAPPSGGGLEDRSNGKLAGLMKDLQEDVMPLAQECYEQALERDASIAGGLGLQFAIIGDEDVGGLVESVDLEEDSDIQDPEMLECMRETLLSTIFPAPDDSGETGVRLTLEFAPDE